MSFNIRYATADDGPNNWANRMKAVPEMLKDVRPTVFGLQEALDAQLSYIGKTCGEYGYVGVGRDDGKLKGERMTVHYLRDEVELLDWGTWWLSETPEKPSLGWDAKYIRTATWTKMRMKADGREFYFVNTHLDHKGKLARIEGLALIIDKIAEMNPDGLPVILTGDFNAIPDDVCLLALNQMMHSARQYAARTDTRGSFNGWGRRETSIDYIYFSGFRRCRRFRVVTKSYACVPYISDHYPIVADMVF